jgi:putative dehydrogenase
MPALKSVGLIGLGLMGEVYASRLIAAGVDVIGFDVEAARNERLLQIGGRVGSLADIARDCDPIVVAVFFN